MIRASALLLLASTSWAQTTSRVSLGTGGVQGNGHSNGPAISQDGRYVLFVSAASNLVPGDTNSVDDVFFRDRQTGLTTRVSVGTGGVESNGNSAGKGISVDGRFVSFTSLATNLVVGDTNATIDSFVHDRETGVTTCVSLNANGVPGNSSSYWPSISADGRYIAFHSFASDLVAGDTNGTFDVFLHDRELGTTTRVSLSHVGQQANGECSVPWLSSEGRHVAFFSSASNLVPFDTNGTPDIFVRDLVAGTTERISVATGGGQSFGFNTFPSISADGRYVAFQSDATTLVTPYVNWGASDVYIRDRVAATTELVSIASDGSQSHADSQRPSISANGRYVAFYSWSNNLVVGDTNLNSDVFLRDRRNGTTVRASVSGTGAQVPGESFSSDHSVSSDGRYVVFYSGDSFVPGDTGFTDCFARDFADTVTEFCFGDGSMIPCPCHNSGQAGHGCDNSDGTGGALLVHSGSPMPTDTVVLHVVDERASSLTIFVQGDEQIGPVAFGDGLRCIGGRLKRMYVRHAVNGAVSAPLPSDPTITARSMAVGDHIPPGATRYYMTYYRDGEAGFCPSPAGNAFTSSNALAIVW